jgi:hypothetical protein
MRSAAMAYEEWRRRRTTARIGGQLFHGVISPVAPYVAAMEWQQGLDHTALAASLTCTAIPAHVAAASPDRTSLAAMSKG